jgi:putative transcriptional regulator
MRSASDGDPHIDRKRFGKKSRAEVNAEAGREKKRLGLTARYSHFRAYIGGRAYEVPVPNVRAIREKLSLSQIEFARRFSLSQRTIQQWEQHRAVPDMPARLLLKVIQLAPDVVEQAATEVRKEIEKATRRGKAAAG